MTNQQQDQQKLVSAAEIVATAPLGAIIRYTDLTPEPPQRFKNKHSLWKRTNGNGRLVSIDTGCDGHPGRLTLHTGDYGANGVVVLTVRQTFLLDTALRFEIAELPAPGSFAVLTKFGDNPELRHLAASQADAEAWLHSNPYTDAYLEPIAATHSLSPKPQIASLADFKKALQTGSRWEFRYAAILAPNEPPTISGWQLREVVHRQTNSVAFAKSFDPTVVAHASKNPHANATWLDFPKAKACTFPEPNQVRISQSDDPQQWIEYRPYTPS